ncbi:MAG TPA: NAD-dependent epimerase/dehydratase family protein [Candidatus Elarobacter sp.]|nr:NAD-dependent epimerase/dehydratase family protein [Candidatus Elarobacter sp.]
MDVRSIAVTGAAGFLGRALVGYFAGAGLRTHALARRALRAGGAQPAPNVVPGAYDLDAEPDPAALRGLDALVHCAFVPHRAPADRSSERNVRGTLALARACREAGVRFVFVSSVSAATEARSEYARHKRAIEEALAPSDAVTIRPGLVAGDGGLLRGLHDAVGRGTVPLIGGGREPVQVVSPEEVGEAILIALRRDLRGAHNAVSVPAVPLRTIVRDLASRASRPVRLVGVPWPAAFAAAALAERAGIRLPLTTDNLRGLRAAAVHAPSGALLAAGWSALPWEARCAELRFGAAAPA